MTIDRRSLLTGLAAFAPGLGMRLAVQAQSHKKRVAAIVNCYYARSHADVIVGRFLDGYSPNGVRVEPRCRIVSMYTDQIANWGQQQDLSRALSKKHGFPILPTVREALTLGGDKLAVDAVLLIGEHGNYPVNEKGQKLYPRYELFSQIVDGFRQAGSSVPVFCDKHLSYSWDNASKMVAASRELGFPMMAGSSSYVSGRVPPLSIELGAPLEKAVSVGVPPGNNFDGRGLESYGFHALEGHQVMIERRAGGETGIAAVQTLMDDAVWKWRDSEDGRWSIPLLKAALERSRRPWPNAPEEGAKRAALFLMDHLDGLRSAVYMLPNGEHLFAAGVRSRPELLSTRFGLAQETRGLSHFDGLVHQIEQFFVTGTSPRPIERTLLVTGALAFLMDSKYYGKHIETPELKVVYKAPAEDYFQRS